MGRNRNSHGLDMAHETKPETPTNASEGLELLRSFEGHDSFINWLAWSPDGARLASASSDQRIQVWDAQTGRRVGELVGHKGQVRCVAWSPDGRHLASASVTSRVVV